VLEKIFAVLCCQPTFISTPHKKWKWLCNDFFY